MVPEASHDSEKQLLRHRELEEQLEEAVKLAEDSAQRRRHAEAQAVSLQADLEAVSAQRGSKGGSGESDSVFQLRMLQDLVQRQEDEVKEARALKSHARYRALSWTGGLSCKGNVLRWTRQADQRQDWPDRFARCMLDIRFHCRNVLHESNCMRAVQTTVSPDSHNLANPGF